MGLDIDLAVGSLRRTVDVLDDLSDPSSTGQSAFIATVYLSLDQLLRDPVIAPVTRRVIQEFDKRHSDVRNLVWSGDGQSRVLAETIAQNLGVLIGRVPPELREQVLVGAVDLAAKVAVGEGRYDALAFLRLLATPTFIPSDDFASTLDTVAANVSNFLVNARGHLGDDGVADATGQQITQLKSRVRQTVSTAAELSRHIEALSMRESVVRLRTFFDAMHGVVQGTVIGESARCLPKADRLREDLWSLRQLARTVHARISTESATFHALRRAKAYFEHFAAKELRAALEHEHRREDRIQERLDRFLFEEGVFPITHAEAASGKLDTFVSSEALPRVEAADAERIPPLLLELKQQVAFGSEKQPTDADLRAAVLHALGQAKSYADHVAANSRWKQPRVCAVVFYTGGQRYYSTRDDVVLVYVGERRPSDGSIQLILD